MNKKIINFYLAANKLKNVVRTGWKELNISSERLESVAEHIYGCLILAIAIESEAELNLDLLKVFKMIVIKELEKITLKENTTRDYPTKEEREEQARKTVMSLTDGLVSQNEILDFLEEINKLETKEAKFVFQLSKIESDIQAKMYDLEGHFDLDTALEDAKYFGKELSDEIIPQIKKASDGFILYDRHYYTDEIFKNLSKDIQDLEEL